MCPNLLLFGHNFGAFDRYNETRIQGSDTFSWVHGKHYAKFGFDTNYVRNFVIWPGFTPARIIFPSLGDLLVSGKSRLGINTVPGAVGRAGGAMPGSFLLGRADWPGPV